LRQPSLKPICVNPDRVSGFTLLELVVVMALIGVLSTLFFPSLKMIRSRAERVVCIGNLRSLHASLSSRLTDTKQWPQVPPGTPNDDLPEFWVEALKDYGTNRKVWLCPSLARFYHDQPANAGRHPRIHYVPGQFGPHASDPLRYPTQPWVMEINGAHGDGNMIIRTDGTVKSFNELLREAGQPTLPATLL